MSDKREREQLRAGADALGCPLAEDQVERLLAYLRLLQRWNRTFNLTADADPGEMVARHLLDSLSVHPWLSGETVLDLGSGAGLPGLPLAILQPARRFVLLESRQKRAAFLQQVRIALGLANVEVLRARAEEVSGETFDTVVVRAFGTLRSICRAADPLLGPQGIILAMKGALQPGEREAIPAGFVAGELHEVRVPGVEAARCIVVVTRNGPATERDRPAHAAGEGPSRRRRPGRRE